MNKILIAFIMLICYNTPVYAIDCAQHPIFCKITILQPKINKKWAMRISNIINKYSKIYNIDPIRSIAIANQESGIKMINRCISVATEKNHNLFIGNGCTDIGLFQININSIRHYNLDINRLNSDVDYNIKAHFIIMKDKLNQCNNLEHSWSCYHSKTEKHRQKYIKAVNKYYERLNND